MSHDKLFKQLRCYGISGNVLEWIKSFLSDRTQVVKVENARSNAMPVLSGIGQGTCLGPLAFILYINDLASDLDGKVQLAKFADDLKIWREVKSDVDQEQLQNCLDSIAEWAANWQMDISVEKCFVMKIGSFSSKFNYKINGTTLSYVNSIKDLGIIVDTNLSYSTHCCAISKKASRRANMILRAFQTRNLDSLVTVFKTFVRPILEYATPVWSPHLIKSKKLVELVQRKFTKRAFYRCFHDCTTPYEKRLTIARLDCLETRRIKFDLLFLFKMLCGNVDLDFDEFLQFDDKHKRNRHCLQLKSVNYPANNFGRFNYFYRTHRVWNNLPQSIFDGVVNLKKVKQALSDICFDSLFGY